MLASYIFKIASFKFELMVILGVAGVNSGGSVPFTNHVDP